MIILWEWIFSVGKDKRTELRIHVCLLSSLFSICVLVESVHIRIVFYRSMGFVCWFFLPNSDLLSGASPKAAVQGLKSHSEPCWSFLHLFAICKISHVPKLFHLPLCETADRMEILPSSQFWFCLQKHAGFECTVPNLLQCKTVWDSESLQRPEIWSKQVLKITVKKPLFCSEFVNIK